MENAEPAAKQPEAYKARLRYWKRALAKGAGRTPDAKIKLAIATAASLTALSEQAFDNPDASNNERVRLTGAARRARAELTALIEARPSAPKLGPDSLKQYISERYGT